MEKLWWRQPITERCIYRFWSHARPVFSEDKVNVCMGKEWYRFPSNFFLPSNNWNVKFIKSEFKGQLPQPFLTEEPHATSIERQNFNDLNLEELDRYVKVVFLCTLNDSLMWNRLTKKYLILKIAVCACYGLCRYILKQFLYMSLSFIPILHFAYFAFTQKKKKKLKNFLLKCKAQQKK